MGQIRKRGKFYQIRYYRNGQQIEESTGFTNGTPVRVSLDDAMVEAVLARLPT